MTEEVRLPDEAEQMLQVEYQKYVEGGGQLPYPEFKKISTTTNATRKDKLLMKLW